MSHQLVNRSPDLKQLRDDGFEVEVRGAFLLVSGVPYVNQARQVKRGTLVTELTLADNRTVTPGTHVINFIGEYPCTMDGAEIAQIRHNSSAQTLTNGLTVNHSFSNKPSGGYQNYYEKVTRYVDIIASNAQAIDPNATARTFKVIEPEKSADEIFKYLDTNSSRAGIDVISSKLENQRVAIVGLGGTGSYVLDFIAKTRVKEIHLFDGDRFLQHNAFRAPGAASSGELRRQFFKVQYLKMKYRRMRDGIVTHPCFINTSNVDELSDFDFVFICVDRSDAKRIIVAMLEETKIPFVDVGMGLTIVNDSLIGILRTTTSTTEMRNHIHENGRINLAENQEDDGVYETDIQIAELNALNASFAVIKWKKIFGFYQDLEREYHSTYSLNVNDVNNDDFRN